MKQLFKPLFFIFLVVLLFACEDRTPAEHLIPEWIKPRLIELENSGDCFGCTLQQSTYNGEFYYHLYCSYWSCSHCEVYRYNGSLVEWSEEFPLSDWLENRTQLDILWQCGDELE